MKKIFFVVLLFVTFFLIKNGGVLAAGYCYPNAISSTCNSNFDCNNNLMTYDQNNPALCAVNYPGSCHEVKMQGNDIFTICYAPLNQPTPTTAPCGTLNFTCCPAPNYCNSGLTPDNTGGGACYCRSVTASPYLTALPRPTSVPATPPATYPDQCDPGDPFDNNGRITSLGCIPININDFVTWLLGKFIFIASGISFILLGYGVLLYMTSQGDTKKIQAGSEMITSTLAGLMFVILSVFLLKMIGVDILRIPGFGQ